LTDPLKKLAVPSRAVCVCLAAVRPARLLMLASPLKKATWGCTRLRGIAGVAAAAGRTKAMAMLLLRAVVATTHEPVASHNKSRASNHSNWATRHPHAAKADAPLPQVRVHRVRGHESVSTLPFCTDEVGHVTLESVCPKIQGQAVFLCKGLLELQRASCDELGDATWMRAIVEKVGLTPDSRAEQLYGNASKSVVQVHGKSARHKVGLWQSPNQLAAALIYVGSRVEVHRYIEVGVFTAWTCCFVSTYLRRVGRLGAFKALAVDIVSTAMAHGTKALLPHLNVTFLFRKAVTMPVAQPFDFCFVDGG
jgi:hypothetical protein